MCEHKFVCEKNDFHIELDEHSILCCWILCTNRQFPQNSAEWDAGNCKMNINLIDISSLLFSSNILLVLNSHILNICDKFLRSVHIKTSPNA